MSPSIASVGMVRRFPLEGKRIAILGASDAQRAVLTMRLHSINATVVELDELTQGSALTENSIDGILDFNVTNAVDWSISGWSSAMSATLSLLKLVHDDWARETSYQRLFYLAVTRLGGTMGYGDAPIDSPLSGLWAGLAKGLPRELPNCRVKVVDFDADAWSQIDKHLIHELQIFDLFEIGYQDGKRWTLAPKKSPLPVQNHVWTESDTILLSGGGRGIGFQIAKEIAKFTRRVVVTGRECLWDDEEWQRWSSVDLRREKPEFLRTHAADGGILQARIAWDRIERMIGLHSNLQEAQSCDLPIEYVQCDIADIDSVRRLREHLPGEMSAIIHNAGIDVSRRLNQKTVAQCLTTISVKIDGFLNLMNVFTPTPRTFVCSVGSMTGRWGGMVGQMDYGAANDGLCRLGMWAAQHYGIPVKTLAWPTWERLGMVSNYEATLQYMDAMPVDRGVELWQAELADRRSGEVGFLGEIGRMITPNLLEGYPAAASLPSIGKFTTMKFFLHTVLQYEPSRRLVIEACLDPRFLPCIEDFLVDDSPSVPFSLLLEQSVHASQWTLSLEGEVPRLLRITDLELDLAAAKVGDSQARIQWSVERKSRGSQQVVHCRVTRFSTSPLADSASLHIGHWNILFGTDAESNDAPLVSTETHFDATFSPHETISSHGSNTTRHVNGSRLNWKWQSFKKPCQRSPQTVTNSAPVSDLFATRTLPTLTLPLNQIEVLLHEAYQLGADPSATVITLNSLELTEFSRCEDMALHRRQQDWALIGDNLNRIVVTNLRTCRGPLTSEEDNSITPSIYSIHAAAKQDRTQPMETKNRANTYLVIGAGAAGLATAKNLRERNVPVEVVEANSEIGGHWNIKLPGSAGYRTLHMISSKRFSEYPDFPMPKHYPTYISHRHACEYLDAYAKEFDLYSIIQFDSPVSDTRRLADGSWEVTIEGQEPRVYAGIVLANGHLRKPKMPRFAGEFTGQIMHSMTYSDSDVMRGKNVLVLGGGNSGCDIAVEASQNANSAFLSLRRGYYFWPKFIFGIPSDLALELALAMRIPLGLRRFFGHYLLRLNSPAKSSDLGLPEPTHKLYSDHFTMNSTLMYAMSHGDIKVKPDVASLRGDYVEFTDDTREKIDLIICATGYDLAAIPFVDDQHLNMQNGIPRFLKQIFHPTYDNLFMVGYFQTNTGNWPMMDWQAKLLSRFVCAQKNRPDKANKMMRHLCKQESSALDGGLAFYGSSRHAIQIEHFSYRKQIKNLIRMLGDTGYFPAEPLMPNMANKKEQVRELVSA